MEGKESVNKEEYQPWPLPHPPAFANAVIDNNESNEISRLQRSDGGVQIKLVGPDPVYI